MEDTTTDDLLHRAWGVIANARDWLETDDQAQEWVDAAERWRDEWLGVPAESPETDVERLWRIVFEHIGTASVCWENPGGAGVFKSEAASDVAVDLINELIACGYIDNFYEHPIANQWAAAT